MRSMISDYGDDPEDGLETGLESDKFVCQKVSYFNRERQHWHTCGLDHGHSGDHSCPTCGDVWERTQEDHSLTETPG